MKPQYVINTTNIEGFSKNDSCQFYSQDMMVIYCKDQKKIFIEEVDNFLKYAQRPGKPMYTREFPKQLK